MPKLIYAVMRFYIVIAFSFFVGSFVCHSQIQDKNIQKLELTYQLINSLYVDTVNQEKIVEESIVAMLKSLDPHSAYISPSEVKAMNEPLDGSFEGIGVQFNIFNDTLMVVNPIMGGPSEKVGILAGDRIVGIDGKNVAGIGIKNSDVYKSLKGAKGTKVKLEILRRHCDSRLNFTVVRDKIPIYSVESAYMATSKTGYIKVTRFAATTYNEFMEALNRLSQSGFESLILDLRGNGGGYLKAAIDITDELIDGRKMLVYTQGLNSPRSEHLADKKGKFEKGNLIVLIDEGSASASEIVSGAVQDWDRGIVIGRRSFGKGLVQRPFDFPDGSMIRLTIAKYYTPSGRCIQKQYEDGDYANEIQTRYLHGEMSNKDSVHFENGEAYKTRLLGRTVYGGGGIMPDVFIPVDTIVFTNYYRDLLATGALNKTVLTYVDGNRKALQAKYPDFKSFSSGFSVDNQFFDELIKEGEAEKVKLNEKQLEISRPLISEQIKALVARDLFTASEYYQVINELSDAYIKAVQIIESKKEYSSYLK